MIIFLMMISYVTSTSSDSDCLSRLSDDLSKDLNAERARIFMISDKNHEMSWTWQIEDGGLSSSLRSPLMPDLSPKFSNDGGLTWTAALVDACQVSDKLTVNFSRIDPEMSEDPAKAKKVRESMQNGIRNPGPGILSWTLEPSEIGLEQSGTWLVEVRTNNMRLVLEFEIIVVLGCTLSSDAAQEVELTYLWLTKSISWDEASYRDSTWRASLPQIQD